MLRMKSPCGDSSLTTSAPSWPSRTPAQGPTAPMLASSTRSPAKGPFFSLMEKSFSACCGCDGPRGPVEFVEDRRPVLVQAWSACVFIAPRLVAEAERNADLASGGFRSAFHLDEGL